MKPRMNYYQAAPETIKALRAVEAQILASGLEKSLIELVKTRASQINGCAYCMQRAHRATPASRGETEERIYLLNAWRESPLYSDRERAALAWTEAVTLVSGNPCPRRPLRRRSGEVLRRGDCPAHDADRRHRRVERFAIGFRAIHPVRVKAAVA